MQKVTSKDGTQIAYEKSGQGATIIIIGGALADHHFYAPLADELAKYFTVYNFDRRGRGQSDNTLPYAVEREIEDVVALIALADQPVFLYGHSAGSALALRLAVAGVNATKLVLADPPFTPHSENDESARVDFIKEANHIEELCAKSDYIGSAKVFLSGYGLSAEELEAMLQPPYGDTLIDCAHTLPYDYAMLGDGLIPDGLALQNNLPTLILAAKEMSETAHALVKLMTNAHLRTLESPTYELAPAVLATVLREFF